MCWKYNNNGQTTNNLHSKDFKKQCFYFLSTDV